MGESLSSWLALRETADGPARSATLTRALADALASHTSLRILDLATGTGSNLRYLASYLPVDQRWLLVDRDPELLAEVPARMSSWATTSGFEATVERGELVLSGKGIRCHVETRRMDLGALSDPQIFSGRHLVTASALLDLVSKAWLHALAARCRAGGAAVLFALTYNGSSRCAPQEPEDGAILDLFNRHQKTNDKGFGPAAGPEAVECAAACLAAVGYHVRREASNWMLPPEAKALQRFLIEGWAEAALDIAPGRAAMIQSWRRRRLAHVEAACSRLVVCHEDLAAWPPSGTTGTK